jgi:hypothetical protein
MTEKTIFTISASIKFHSNNILPVNSMRDMLHATADEHNLLHKFELLNSLRVVLS